MDRAAIADDPHLARGCAACHGGDERAADRTMAHAGLVKRPSDDGRACAGCHPAVTATHRTSLHATAAGLRRGAMDRLAPADHQRFSERVFPQACQSCHASCGDCHVKSPTVAGVDLGLLRGHRFVRRNEGKTCALCHGGRVYPEFTGEYGGTADVHYEKGMMCADCHPARELHGDGTAVTSRREVAGRPACAACHPPGSEKTAKAASAHERHRDRLGCAACHASGPYRNCTDCHLGAGAKSTPAFVLGRSPREPGRITTLRLVPTVRTTFEPAGLELPRYDDVPNYWDTVPHNIRKRTDRTRSCAACHEAKRGFLAPDTLPPGGSKANEALIGRPRSLGKE